MNSIREVFGIEEEPCFIGGASILECLFNDPLFNKINKMYITEFDDYIEALPNGGKFLELPTNNFKIVSCSGLPRIPISHAAWPRTSSSGELANFLM